MTCGSFLLQKKNSLKIGSVCDSVRSVTQISTLKPIGGFRIIKKRQVYWNKVFGRAVESKAIWQDGTFQSFSINQFVVIANLTNPQKVIENEVSKYLIFYSMNLIISNK